MKKNVEDLIISLVFMCVMLTVTLVILNNL